MASRSADDPYDLARYVSAQQPVYGEVCAELAAGRKQTHWMWFIFPQLKGLGSSPTAKHYGIGSLTEARAYLAHPLLGTRLRECTALVNGLQGATAQAIFGYPDYLKFCSCMTLFAHAAGEAAADEGEASSHPANPAAPAAAAQQVFVAALRKYFAGEGDPLTRELLRAS